MHNTLTEVQRQEWNKVKGRFQEIVLMNQWNNCYIWPRDELSKLLVSD